MKYIDAEKLKTWLENEADMEFKKTEENANSPVLCHFHNGCRMQALDTIDFITSLQQEQPGEKLKNDDIGKYVREHFYYNKELYGYSHSKDLSVFTTDDIINLAHHFYELGLNAGKKQLPEIELEKFTEKIKTFQARYKHPEIVSIKGAMAFMARMFYQYPNVARQWYDSQPKATMD